MPDAKDLPPLRECCPVCFYDLQGLPEPCLCPECGKACEKHGLIWRPHWPLFLALGPPLTIAFVLYALIGGQVIEITVKSGLPPAVLGLIPVIAISACVLWATWVSRRGLFVIMEARGIRYRLSSVFVNFVAWSDVEKIMPARYDHTVHLLLRHLAKRYSGVTQNDPSGPPELAFKVFRSPKDVLRFVEIANQRRTAELHRLAAERGHVEVSTPK